MSEEQNLVSSIVDLLLELSKKGEGPVKLLQEMLREYYFMATVEAVEGRNVIVSGGRVATILNNGRFSAGDEVLILNTGERLFAYYPVRRGGVVELLSKTPQSVVQDIWIIRDGLLHDYIDAAWVDGLPEKLRFDGILKDVAWHLTFAGQRDLLDVEKTGVVFYLPRASEYLVWGSSTGWQLRVDISLNIDPSYPSDLPEMPWISFHPLYDRHGNTRPMLPERQQPAMGPFVLFDAEGGADIQELMDTQPEGYQQLIQDKIEEVRARVTTDAEAAWQLFCDTHTAYDTAFISACNTAIESNRSNMLSRLLAQHPLPWRSTYYSGWVVSTTEELLSLLPGLGDNAFWSANNTLVWQGNSLLLQDLVALAGLSGVSASVPFYDGGDDIAWALSNGPKLQLQLDGAGGKAVRGVIVATYPEYVEDAPVTLQGFSEGLIAQDLLQLTAGKIPDRLIVLLSQSDCACDVSGLAPDMVAAAMRRLYDEKLTPLLDNLFKDKPFTPVVQPAHTPITQEQLVQLLEAR